MGKSKIVCGVLLLGSMLAVGAAEQDYGSGFRDVRLGEKLSVVLKKFQGEIRTRSDVEKTGEMRIGAKFDSQSVEFSFISENPAVTSELMRFSKDELMQDFYNSKLVEVEVVFPEANFPMDSVCKKVAESTKQTPVEKKSKITFQLSRNGKVLPGYYVVFEEYQTIYTDPDNGHETIVKWYSDPSVYISKKVKNRNLINTEEFLKSFYTDRITPYLLEKVGKSYRLPKSSYTVTGLTEYFYPNMPSLTKRSVPLMKKIAETRQKALDEEVKKKAEAERKEQAKKLKQALDF